MEGKAIFWDFDGTLAYRAGMWSGALAEALAAHDPACPITGEDLRPYLRDRFPWHTPDIPHPHLCSAERWWEYVEGVLAGACAAAGLAEEAAALVARRARHCYLDTRGWALFDDVVPTLGLLRERGWRHVIVSNHVPELPALVEALGLGPLVEHVVAAAVVGYEKPHPEIYRIALGLARDPREAWMVGDNVVADVLGAERAGLRGILVCRDDARARRPCADLRGVVALLEGGDTVDRLERARLPTEP